MEVFIAVIISMCLCVDLLVMFVYLSVCLSVCYIVLMYMYMSYIITGWWHSVINMTHTVAVTQVFTTITLYVMYCIDKQLLYYYVCIYIYTCLLS